MLLLLCKGGDSGDGGGDGVVVGVAEAPFHQKKKKKKKPFFHSFQRIGENKCRKRGTNPHYVINEMEKRNICMSQFTHILNLLKHYNIMWD